VRRRWRGLTQDYFAELEAAAITYDEASSAADEVLESTSDPMRDYKEQFPLFAEDLGTASIRWKA